MYKIGRTLGVFFSTRTKSPAQVVYNNLSSTFSQETIKIQRKLSQSNALNNSNGSWSLNFRTYYISIQNSKQRNLNE